MSTGSPRWVLGHHVTPLETLGDYGMLRIVTKPHVPGPPPHHHEDAHEFFHILEGSMEVMCDGEWTHLESGESFNVPKGSVHTFRNQSDVDCHWITAFSPRGFERFFEDFGVPVEEEGSFEASVAGPMIGRVIAECASYGMILAPMDQPADAPSGDPAG